MKNKSKRIMALCLVLALALPLLSVPAYADETGSSETEAVIPAETVYIKDADDLKKLAENCVLDSWSQGRTVILLEDISLDGMEDFQIPIFCGVFEGGVHTISGLKQEGSLSPAGLFGILQDTAVVKDLKVSGTVSPSGDGEVVGGIAGLNYGIVMNCSFIGTVSGKSSTGGIIGINGLTGQLHNCVSSGATFGEKATGGIAGANRGTVTACKNESYINIAGLDPAINVEDVSVSAFFDMAQLPSSETLNVTSDTGGIVGYSSGAVITCANTGMVGYQHSGYNVGGVIGRNSAYIMACTNEGTVYGRKDVGGIVGQMEPYIVVDLSQDVLAQLQNELLGLNYLMDTAVYDAGAASDTAAARVGEMSYYVDAAASIVRDLISEASGEGDVPTIPTVTDATLEELSAAINGIADQFRLLSSEMYDASGTLTNDMQAIGGKVQSIEALALSTASEVQDASVQDIIQDTSDVDIDSVTFGKALACENSGEVMGDVNVGGIAGAMAVEHELDPEDDVSSYSSNLLQKQYELKSILQKCVNIGSVTAKKDCAGAVCGRMDLGLALDCEGYGRIESESGDYVGGIAGYVCSTVRSCSAKCTLSGGSYVGGIVGSGVEDSATGSSSTVEKCISLVEIERCDQHCGAISGFDAGTFLENVFVSDTLAGISGVSLKGQAEPCLYSELTSRESVPDRFKHFTLSFVVDGVTIDSLSFNYGASFPASVYPALPQKEGCYAVWDTKTLNELHFDKTVTAVYTPYITALESEQLRDNGRPVLYVEGSFSEGDSLTVTAQSDDPPIASNGASIGQWYIELPDYGQAQHTVRYLPESGEGNRSEVYVRNNGAWEKLKFNDFGSYICFDIDGGSAEIAVVEAKANQWIWLILVGALLLLTLAFMWLILNKKSRFHALLAGFKERRAASRSEEKAHHGKNHFKSRRLVRIWTAAVCAIVLVALAVAVFLPSSPLRARLEAIQMLRVLSKQEELSAELEIGAAIGDRDIQTLATLWRTNADSSSISCVETDGVKLYYANNAIFFENGKGYTASGLFPNYYKLIEHSRDVLPLALMSCSEESGVKSYDISAAGKDAKAILSLLTPAYAERLCDEGTVHIILEAENDALISMRFEGSGFLNDEAATPITVSACLSEITFQHETGHDVPQAVLDSIKSGSYSELDLSESIFALASAWVKLDGIDPLCADIILSADCGPLLLKDALTYHRVNAGEAEIRCIERKDAAVYFTDSAVCGKSGQAANTAESALTGSVNIIELAYQLCMNGEFSCTEAQGQYIYKFTLSDDDIRSFVCSIVPEAESMDINFDSASLRVAVKDGVISTIRFRASGSARVVLADVGATVSAAVTFDGKADMSFTVPARVTRALTAEQK